MANMRALRLARVNANARPRMTRKATPTATAMPALAPVERGSELNGVAVELGVEVWLTAAAVTEVVVVEEEVDDNEVEVVDVEVDVVVGAELAVEE